MGKILFFQQEFLTFEPGPPGPLPAADRDFRLLVRCVYLRAVPGSTSTVAYVYLPTYLTVILSLILEELTQLRMARFKTRYGFCSKLVAVRPNFVPLRQVPQSYIGLNRAP